MQLGLMRIVHAGDAALRCARQYVCIHRVGGKVAASQQYHSLAVNAKETVPSAECRGLKGASTTAYNCH